MKSLDGSCPFDAGTGANESARTAEANKKRSGAMNMSFFTDLFLRVHFFPKASKTLASVKANPVVR